jgi:hypothetical protein
MLLSCPIGAEVRDQLGVSCVPVFQTVPVAAEGGEGLWGLARTVKAGVSRALKEKHVLDTIREAAHFRTTPSFTQYFNFKTVIKVGQTSRPSEGNMSGDTEGDRHGSTTCKSWS